MKICPLCGCKCDNEARFCPRDGSVLPSDSFVGRVLMGQFEILEEVGHGATGRVFKARQSTMDRIVAVKFLKQEYASEPSVVLRFQREAKASARLMHPNIITVYLVGRTEEGVPYLVMEYLEGEDLDAVCKNKGPLDLDQVVLIGRQIADALTEAHSNDVVHRDLKPANIKLCERRSERLLVKVLDFGIAKILEEGQGRESRLTKTGTVFGTPYYLSPEQASGDDVDHRADIYSLGVILYQMMTGRVPFDSKSGLEVLVHHIRNEPPNPRLFRGEIPVALEEIILKCLEKKRENRFATADDLACALKSIEEGGSALSRKGSGPRTVATLDMTGWNKKPEEQGSGTPYAGSVDVQKGTVLGMGGVDQALAQAALVKNSDSGPLISVASSKQPSDPKPVHKEAGEKSNGIVCCEEPATDSVTGKVTLFRDRPEKRVVPAPAPYVPPPEITGPTRPGERVGIDAPVGPVWTSEATPDPITQPADRGDFGSEDQSPQPMQDGSGQPDFQSPGYVPERSGWGGEKVDTFESEFEMSHFGKGRSILLIVSVVILAAGALAAGGYFLFKDGRLQKRSSGTFTEKKENPELDKRKNEQNGDHLDKLARPAAPITRGVTLAEGQRSGRISLEGMEVILQIEGELRPGGRAQIEVEVKDSSGNAPDKKTIATLQAVDPMGEVESLDAVKQGASYRSAVSWRRMGLHRIVVSCGDSDGDPSTAWFAVPISKTASRRVTKDDSMKWNTPEELESKKFERGITPSGRKDRDSRPAPKKRPQPREDKIRPDMPFDDLPEPPDKPEPRPGTRKDELPPPPLDF